MTDSTPTPRDTDRLDDARLEGETVTNDAVAGETVFSGDGDGNDGPTGGSPREGEPDWDRYGPDATSDESQPVGDKAPDDLRDEDPRD
jgi:hypothetical protein